MLKNKILTLTMNPAIDKSACIQQMLPSIKLRCSEPVFTPGGGGVNVARAIHNLGGQVMAIFPSGGPTGDILESLLKKEDILLCRIKTTSWTRENLAIVEETTRQQYRFEMPGVICNEAEVQLVLEEVIKLSATADYLIISGSLSPGITENFYAQCVARLAGFKLKLIVDTSGAPLKALKGSGVFIIKPNLREFRDLTGKPLISEKDQCLAAREMINDGTCRIVVLSMGPEGVLLVTKDDQVRYPSAKVDVKSRIGAGDSTVAGIVLGLSRQMDLKDAVMFGIACGASTVSQPGNELCQKDEVDQIYKQLKEGGSWTI